MEHVLAQFLARFTYPALIAVLAVAGLGVPISEDLALLLAGALAAHGPTRFWPTLAAGFFGVLLGDALIHQWGRRLGPRAYLKPWVLRAFPPARQEKLRLHFARRGALTVVVGRHTPLLRAPIFFLSGASGLPLWKFLIADALSAAVTVPVVVRLGYLFAEHLPEIRQRIHHVEWVLGGAAALCGAAFFWWRRRGKRAAREAPAEPAGPIGPDRVP